MTNYWDKADRVISGIEMMSATRTEVMAKLARVFENEAREQAQLTAAAEEAACSAHKQNIIAAIEQHMVGIFDPDARRLADELIETVRYVQ